MHDPGSLPPQSPERAASTTGEHARLSQAAGELVSDYREPIVARIPTGAVPTVSPNRGRIWPWLVVAAALLGCVYSAVSTHSFVLRLDGQTHAVACAILPGDTGQSTGCATALLSPYSSVFRSSLWGGIPVSLPAFGVFAFLAGFAAWVGLSRERARVHTGFLLLATLLPVATSIIFAVISVTKLGEFCSTCIGIYIASLLAFTFALIAHLRAPPTPAGVGRWGRWGGWFFEGVAVVGGLTALYAMTAPSERESVTRGCGELVKREDEAKVLLKKASVGEQPRVPALVVVDPLCPSCRALDERLVASGLRDRLEVELLVMPLDAKCNWMVKSSPHPGACLISEAMLCAPASAHAILDYAYREQARLTELGKTNESALKADLETQFAEIKGCVGSAAAKAKVNKSLRFAVANAMPVMTPQLFVGGTRVCDEDTDLGLEFTLTRMLERIAVDGARGVPP